jgi:hypothetical protein
VYVIDDPVSKEGLVIEDQRDEVLARDVFCRDDREVVPTNTLRKADVADVAARNGAADGQSVEHARQRDVVDVLRCARYLAASLLAGNRGSDYPVFHLFTLHARSGEGTTIEDCPASDDRPDHLPFCAPSEVGRNGVAEVQIVRSDGPLDIGIKDGEVCIVARRESAFSRRQTCKFGRAGSHPAHEVRDAETASLGFGPDQ